MAEKQEPRDTFWRQLIHKRQGVIGLLMLVSIFSVALLAPWISPYDPYESVQATAADVMAPPSPEHLLGQDEVGRDLLSMVIYGGRISLLVGFAAGFITLLIGTTVGLVSGYAGGGTDTLLMRFTDFILVIPQLPLMLVIIAVAGRGINNTILVIGLLTWTFTARATRSQVLSIKERQFILRARAIGVSDFGIMTRHILPQVLPVIFASATLVVSFAILTEASLSFLGLGDQRLISWGSILNRAFLRGAVSRGAWWYLAPPGFALVWVTLGLAMLSNAVQEIVNPRLQTHHLFAEHKLVGLLNRSPKKGETP